MLQVVHSLPRIWIIGIINRSIARLQDRFDISCVAFCCFLTTSIGWLVCSTTNTKALVLTSHPLQAPHTCTSGCWTFYISSTTTCLLEFHHLCSPSVDSVHIDRQHWLECVRQESHHPRCIAPVLRPPILSNLSSPHASFSCRWNANRCGEIHYKMIWCCVSMIMIIIKHLANDNKSVSARISIMIEMRHWWPRRSYITSSHQSSSSPSRILNTIEMRHVDIIREMSKVMGCTGYLWCASSSPCLWYQHTSSD